MLAAPRGSHLNVPNFETRAFEKDRLRSLSLFSEATTLAPLKRTTHTSIMDGLSTCPGPAPGAALDTMISQGYDQSWCRRPSNTKTNEVWALSNIRGHY